MIRTNTLEIEKVQKEIIRGVDYVIFGAQVVAYGAYCAIKELTGRKPFCFAVGKKGGNPEEIDGIPVRSIDEISNDLLMIVAVTELVQKEVLPTLVEKGFNTILPLTASAEHMLMSAFYKKIGRFPIVADQYSETSCDYQMYEIRNDRDAVLSGPPTLYAYECPIQAGAALSEKKGILTDDTGESISKKNRQYCEMTAVYWIWKNRKHDFVGIEHYRRHLLVTPTMLTGEEDAILPLPYMCYPNEIAQFRRFVSEDVLAALIETLKVLHPEEFDVYEKILNGPYQYTYNLLCARWDVFDDYCRWFFEITEYMEVRYGQKVPELVETRAFSYVAEVLTNLYFMYHQNDLRIRHVDKAIYV